MYGVGGLMIKDSYSRVNESKQQLNSFIIYDLDSIARVNDNFLDYKIAKEKICTAEARSRAI